MGVQAGDGLGGGSMRTEWRRVAEWPVRLRSTRDGGVVVKA
jgi:hypothetical protein